MAEWRLMEDAITLRDRMKMAWFVLTNSRLTNGTKVKEFENEYLDFLEAKHADVMASLKSGKYTDENTAVLEKVAKELASKY